jgi:predicted cupin superfamily sugar epimerase
MERDDTFDPAGDFEGSIITTDNLQLRRSDREDAKEIEVFLEESKYAAYTRIFASKDILHLIETSFLSISVLSPEGKIVAFASFDHSPIVPLSNSYNS